MLRQLELNPPFAAMQQARQFGAHYRRSGTRCRAAASNLRMSENLVTPLKWVEYLCFENGCFRGTFQTQPAASPQSGLEPKVARLKLAVKRSDGLKKATIATKVSPYMITRGTKMEFGSLAAMLIIGALAGWLSGKIMEGRGFGLIGNIIVGIVGAFLAGLIFPALGFSVGGGVVASIVHATIGAVILLFLIGLVKRA